MLVHNGFSWYGGMLYRGKFLSVSKVLQKLGSKGRAYLQSCKRAHIEQSTWELAYQVIVTQIPAKINYKYFRENFIENKKDFIKHLSN